MSLYNPMIKTSEAHAYIEIEKFVRLVVGTSDMPFHVEIDQNDQPVIIPRLLAKEFQGLTNYWGHYNVGYSYEPEQQAYWDACMATGFLNVHCPTEQAFEYNQNIHAHAYAVNDLVRFIRARADTKAFQRRVCDRKYQASEKCDSVERFVSEALARYARSLVVRVDFGYQKSSQHLVTIEDVYNHVDALCMAKQSDDAFRGLVGYGLAIEQGVERGYHIHFVAIIDGNQFQSSWYRGTEYARLWQRIAGNHGSAFICSEQESYYHAQGVGHFRRDEPESHGGIVRVAQYLTEYKEDQYLRAKPEGRRVLRLWLSKRS